jgi:hypothetical protein
MIADLVNGHFLFEAPQCEPDDGAFGDVEPRSADKARDARFFEELEEAFVEVEGRRP